MLQRIPNLHGDDREQVTNALDLLTESLEGAPVAAWLFGSAVERGLAPESDVDMLVVIDRELPDDIRRRIVDGLLTVSAPVSDRRLGRPLELTILRLADVKPWQYPPQSQLVYGEWLRDEFEQGNISGASNDPDLAIVIHQARECSVTLLGEPACDVLEPVPRMDIQRAIRDSLPQLVQGLVGDERNVLLTLARMWYTAALGETTSKDRAAEWAMHRLPENHAQLLDLARKAYLGKSRDDWQERQAPLAAFVAAMQASIMASLDEN